ncbi:MAG TPA: BTAD domain-containing putative transcriptional regulator, partial [Candidatus Acidoferrum sp.]|nr:BTAD domain-containing putative transcriptional regulator [Candidatus Acidoferrum sp.]
MGADVGISVESSAQSGRPSRPSLEIRLLGPLRISRDDVTLPLPASRKVRALLAYLSLAPHAVSRSHLCELLWEVPNDPRGELRWCLSKIRGLVDEPGRRRVESQADTVGLDLRGCFVDAIEVARALAEIDTIGAQGLRMLNALFAGDFLDGLEMESSPAFNGWLIGQRRRFRGCHRRLLEHLVRGASEDETLGYLEQWLELDPFDLRVHELLFNALAACDRIREGEEHVAAATRLFETEGLDYGVIREAWRSARARRASHAVTTVAPSDAATDGAVIAPRRASVAIMPFLDCSAVAGVHGGIADALAHDVITRLAKL